MATVTLKKLRGSLTVDFDVATFSEAGDKEKLLMEFADKLREHFPNVDLVVTERRERESKKAAAAPRRSKAA